MKRFTRTSLATAVGLAFLGLAPVTDAKKFETFEWQTVVNNGEIVPTCLPDSVETRKFNSYSQPSVNEAGLVVFRGRSKGADGGGDEGGDAIALAAPVGETGPPARGVYSRQMAAEATPIDVVACVRDPVPEPNNLYDPEGNTSGEVLGTFNEFPAFPRIDATSSSIATRGQSTPVWEYVYGVDSGGNNLTSRVGTSGVYVELDQELWTGASLLGNAPVDYPDSGLAFPEYSVPGGVEIPGGTKFDQFPGGPTIAGGTFVAFKGNFSVDGVGKTGVFFRDVSDEINMTYLVANNVTTKIPGSTTTFGSTAPPTAAGGWVFFVGSDNEESPTKGGIYRSPMDTSRLPGSAPAPTKLIGIGEDVPGETATFTRFGEGLSVSKDGNLVAFWGAWGTATQTVMLKCSPDGNKARQDECMLQSPPIEGLDSAIPANHTGVVTRQVPVNQGIFVHNVSTGVTVRIAKTGLYGYTDFLYWVFSGAPPGVGHGDGTREPPKWRSSAFAAVSMLDKKDFGVAFKGTQEGLSGIFLGDGSEAPVAVVKQLDDGTKIDPLAPPLSLVTAVGIERDGFRGQNLAITAAMLYEGVDEEGEEISIGWAGIYLTNIKKLK